MKSIRGTNVIDKYVRNLLSPCNRCGNMISWSKHCCKKYKKKDGIPPKIYSGHQMECDGFVEKKDI